MIEVKRPHVVAVATHPVQYHAPWFRALAERPEFSFEVLFVTLPDAQQQGVGFGIPFQWDLPLLEGYDSALITEVAGPGDVGRFWGIRLRHPSLVLDRSRPDVLILTGWQSLPLLQLLWAARRCRIPVMVRGDSNSLKPRPLSTRLLHQWLLRMYDAFLVVGKANRAFYEGNGVSSERIFNACHFVDNARFSEQVILLEGERQQLRSFWGIPQGSVCFCYVGKLEPKKRLLDLLKALRILMGQEGSPVVHLLVVGAGELMDEARTYADAHRLPVTFAGFLNQTEIARAYAAIDCLVLPSDYGETWGLVVNEAMACARPALVSDRVGCGPDLIVPGLTGEVFPFGDTAGLAKRLSRLASIPKQLVEMGKAAQLKVMEEYSVGQAAEGTVAAVRYLCTGDNR